MSSILSALPEVRRAVAAEIGARIKAGEQVASVSDDKVIVDGKVVADLAARRRELLNSAGQRRVEYKSIA